MSYSYQTLKENTMEKTRTEAGLDGINKKGEEMKTDEVGGDKDKGQIYLTLMVIVWAIGAALWTFLGTVSFHFAFFWVSMGGAFTSFLELGLRRFKVWRT